MEIGIQAGILLLADMFQNIQGERKNDGIDYCAMSKSMSEDIKKALDIIVDEAVGREKPSLENWQKYMENGEYLRSSEIDEEQNYNMIDGRRK